jgi:hypothetical protein
VIDESPLEPDVRALLANARESLGPDRMAVARLQSRIDVAVQTHTVLAVPAMLKLAAALATVGAVVAGAHALRSSSSAEIASMPAVAPQLELAAHEAGIEISVRAVAREADAPAPAPAPAPARAVLSASPSQSASSSHSMSPSHSGSLSHPASPSPSPSLSPPPARSASSLSPPPARSASPQRDGLTLAREIELIDRATAALRAHDTNAAVRALEVYDTETRGHGQLAQDAGALHVEALCRAAAPEAPAAFARFIASWPTSPQRRHLESVCNPQRNAKE